MTTHTDYQPLSKWSRTIHRRKGDVDERPLAVKCAPAVKSAGKEKVKANPRPKRIVDHFAKEWVKKWGRCQHCGKSKARSSDKTLHVHHIQSRGAFGDDVPENLVLLCWDCHAIVHQTGKISREELKRLAQDRMRLMPMPVRRGEQ